MKQLVEWSSDPLSHDHFTSMLENLNTLDVNRICFHESERSGLHVMLISIPPNTVYPTHRHLSVDEWYIVIHGQLLIRAYDVMGTPTESYVLTSSSELCTNSSASSGLLMKANIFHDTCSLSEGAIFVEVRPGPFNKSDTEYLPMPQPYA